MSAILNTKHKWALYSILFKFYDDWKHDLIILLSACCLNKYHTCYQV